MLLDTYGVNLDSEARQSEIYYYAGAVGANGYGWLLANKPVTSSTVLYDTTSGWNTDFFPSDLPHVTTPPYSGGGKLFNGAAVYLNNLVGATVSITGSISGSYAYQGSFVLDSITSQNQMTALYNSAGTTATISATVQITSSTIKTLADYMGFSGSGSGSYSYIWTYTLTHWEITF